jgi:rubrerythrin
VAIQGIDIDNLSLKDALDLATLIEEEARDRYEELAEQMQVHHTPGAEAFFRKMVRIEDKHRVELEKRRHELFGSAARRVNRSMIFDIEAPEYDLVRQGMTARDAFAAAMSSEVKAHDFFVAALPRVKNPQVKALFEELRDEEIEHKQWVQAEIDRLPPAPSTPEDDVSDEPVAH